MNGPIRLATGLAVANGCVLLVASSYPSHPHPLWNLPGGRVATGELLRQTVVREIAEETGLRSRITDLAYVSESYDGARHVLNVTFAVETSGAIALPAAGDHIVAVEWVPIGALSERIAVAVVRDPLVRYLRDRTRYHGFAQAGITIEWPAGTD